MRKLALICLLKPWLALADGEWTQYKGTFQDVTFPGQQRVVTTQEVSVVLPLRTLPRGNPGPQGRLVIFGKSYPIKNVYQTQTQLIYLACKGPSSAVLLLPAPPPQKLEEQTTSMSAVLLFSDRESAREVKGSMHILPLQRTR